MSARGLIVITLFAALAIAVIEYAFFDVFKEYTEPTEPGGKSKFETMLNPSTNLLNYENSAWGVRMDYPASWKKTEGINLLGSEEVEFFSPLDMSFKMTYYYTRVGSSIDDFGEAFIEDLREQIGRTTRLSNTSISSEKTSLGGNPALRIDFIGSKEGQEYRVVTIRVIRADRMYDVTYSLIDDPQFSEYSGSIQEMLDSLEFSNPKPSYSLYESRGLGARIKYPETWQKNERTWSRGLGLPPEVSALFPSGVGFSVPNQIAAVAVAVIDSGDEPMNYDEWRATIVAALKEYAYESLLVESGYTTLSGVPGYRMVFLYKLRETDPGHKAELLLATKGKKTYLVVYNAWDESTHEYYKDVFDEMAGSFEITS